MQAGQYDEATTLVAKIIELEVNELGARQEVLAGLYSLASMIQLEVVYNHNVNPSVTWLICYRIYCRPIVIPNSLSVRFGYRVKTIRASIAGAMVLGLGLKIRVRVRKRVRVKMTVKVS